MTNFIKKLSAVFESLHEDRRTDGETDMVKVMGAFFNLTLRTHQYGGQRGEENGK
jgi:hypothetical protein